MYEAVNSAAVPNQHNESYFEATVLPEGSSGASSANVGTMDEAVEYAAITNQHNEEDT